MSFAQEKRWLCLWGIIFACAITNPRHHQVEILDVPVADQGIGGFENFNLRALQLMIFDSSKS